MLRKLLILLTVATLFTTLDASIIKKPPTKPAESYKELVCTENDQNVIYEIISTMAEKSKLSLAFERSRLKELGAQINHVHPLKFLSTIFSDDYLKGCMKGIWNDHFKKNGFLDGLAPSLTREAEQGKLEQYLKDFADEVHVKVEGLKPYFDAREWEELVLHLIYS